MSNPTEYYYPVATRLSQLPELMYQVYADNLRKAGDQTSVNTFTEMRSLMEHFAKQMTALQRDGFSDPEILKWGNFVITSTARTYSTGIGITSTRLRLLIDTGKVYCSDFKEIFGSFVLKEQIEEEKHRLQSSIDLSQESKNLASDRFKI